MKTKTFFVLLAFCLASVWLFLPAIAEQATVPDMSRVYVYIDNAFSGIGRKYTPADFSAELVSEVIPLMCGDGAAQDDDKDLRDFVLLKLNDPCTENYNNLLMTLASNELVESAITAENYDAGKVLVAIRHEYSGTDKEYTPADFSAELVKKIVPVMYIDGNTPVDANYNYDAFQDVLSLELKEPGVENIEKLLVQLTSNELVANVSLNCYMQPDSNARPSADSSLDTVLLLGDIDLDTEVTAADARLALRASVGLENYTEQYFSFVCADHNQDGVITAVDARAILRTAIGLEPPKHIAV